MSPGQAGLGSELLKEAFQLLSAQLLLVLHPAAPLWDKHRDALRTEISGHFLSSSGERDIKQLLPHSSFMCVRSCPGCWMCQSRHWVGSGQGQSKAVPTQCSSGNEELDVSFLIPWRQLQAAQLSLWGLCSTFLEGFARPQHPKSLDRGSQLSLVMPYLDFHQALHSACA